MYFIINILLIISSMVACLRPMSIGYTKHYYAGTEHLATVIGGGGFNKMTSPIDTLRTHDNYIRANAFPYYERNDPFYYHHTISDPLQTEDISGRPLNELQYHCGQAWLENPNWETMTNTFWGGPVFLDSNGTFGITLSFALIGGISISISGELFYEGNE